MDDKAIDWQEIQSIVKSREDLDDSSQDNEGVDEQEEGVPVVMKEKWNQENQDDHLYPLLHDRDPFMGSLHPTASSSSSLIVQDLTSCPQAATFDFEDWKFVQRMQEEAVDTSNESNTIIAETSRCTTVSNNQSLLEAQFFYSEEYVKMIHRNSSLPEDSVSDMDSEDDGQTTDIDIDVFFPYDSRDHDYCLKRALQEDQEQDQERDEDFKEPIPVSRQKKKKRDQKEKKENPKYVLVEGSLLIPYKQYEREVTRKVLQESMINQEEPRTSMSIRFKSRKRKGNESPVDKENLHQDEDTERLEEAMASSSPVPFVSLKSISFPEKLFTPSPTGFYRKPQLSYTCLIALCMYSKESGRILVGEMYDYIEDSFPFFKTAQIVWRNSLRHCLSLTRTFTKIGEEECMKAKKGFEWAVKEDKKRWLTKEMFNKRFRCINHLMHTLGSPKVIFDMRRMGLLHPDLEAKLFGYHGCPPAVPSVKGRVVKKEDETNQEKENPVESEEKTKEVSTKPKYLRI